MRIAVALDLPWRPATTEDQVVIRRAATVIAPGMIEEAIKNEVAARGISGEYTLSFSRTPEKIILPQDEEQSLEILGFTLQPGSDSFTAELVAPSKEKPIKQITVSGRLERMMDIPVLVSTMQNGDIINASAIKTITVAMKDIGEDWVLKEEDLIHMTPRRMVAAGKPLKRSEIEAPVIVERGDLITMTFNQNGLSLTAQGKALQNGAKGDVIRVVNASSNKTVQGIVTGTKEITVESF
jgi:flagella basal body P-ring formation protein FlgA